MVDISKAMILMCLSGFMIVVFILADAIVTAKEVGAFLLITFMLLIIFVYNILVIVRGENKNGSH